MRCFTLSMYVVTKHTYNMENIQEVSNKKNDIIFSNKAAIIAKQIKYTIYQYNKTCSKTVCVNGYKLSFIHNCL